MSVERRKRKRWGKDGAEQGFLLETENWALEEEEGVKGKGRKKKGATR